MTKQIDAEPRNIIITIRKDDAGNTVKIVTYEGYCSDPVAANDLDKQPRPVRNTATYDGTKTATQLETDCGTVLETKAGI